jgi:hypothetical protein
MNHFLVSVLGIMNGALALAIVVIFTVLGDSWGSRVEATQSHVGALFGLIVGLAVAVIVCGLLAIAISIEKSLKHLATNTDRWSCGM